MWIINGDALVKAINHQTDMLNRLITQGETIMATEQDLQDSVDSLTAGVTAANTELDALHTLVVAIPAGQTVSQDQLDALTTQVSAARDALAAAVAADTPPPPA